MRPLREDLNWTKFPSKKKLRRSADVFVGGWKNEEGNGGFDLPFGYLRERGGVITSS